MKRWTAMTAQEKSIGILQLARAAAAILFLAMIAMLGYHGYEYWQGKQIYESIRVEAYGGGDAVRADNGVPSEEEIPADGAQIDFAALYAMNPDCVAWIRGCDGSIDYPVVLSGDDGYYLTHTIDGRENKAGSIFVDQYTEAPFEQFQTILYGHNRKDGSMFHSLLNYREEAYWENHQTITVYLEGETREYRIFSAYYQNYETLPVYQDVETQEQRQAYLDTAFAMSLYDTQVEVDTDDRLLILITCEYSGKGYRMVVCAVQC